MKRALIVVAGFVIATVAIVTAAPAAIRWVERNQAIAERKDIVLPPPIRPGTPPSGAASSSQAPVQSSKAGNIRAAVNWDVPFTSQTPLGNWDALHKEACEEASVLTVLRYFDNRPFTSPEEADEEIVALVHANTALGFPVDDTAEQIVDLIQSQNPALDAELLKNPSVDAIKEVLSEGKLVIVPAQGQLLGNPYFQTPGPPYHMLVIRGFTDSGFAITNDPGTKRGEAFVYKWDVLMNAIHDWNGGDVMNGAKVVVVVGE